DCRSSPAANKPPPRLSTSARRRTSRVCSAPSAPIPPWSASHRWREENPHPNPPPEYRRRERGGAPFSPSSGIPGGGLGWGSILKVKSSRSRRDGGRYNAFDVLRVILRGLPFFASAASRRLPFDVGGTEVFGSSVPDSTSPGLAALSRDSICFA